MSSLKPRWLSRIATHVTTALTLVGLGCAPASDVSWPSIKKRIAEEFPDVPQLSTNDLSEWLASERPTPLLVDVRTQEEYDVSHLPGAIRADSFEQIRDLLTAHGSAPPIVLYCSVGYRSSRLAQEIRQHQYDAQNLDGSIFQWANESRPLESASGTADRVHPYDDQWGRLLDHQFWK